MAQTIKFKDWAPAYYQQDRVKPQETIDFDPASIVVSEAQSLAEREQFLAEWGYLMGRIENRAGPVSHA